MKTFSVFLPILLLTCAGCAASDSMRSVSEHGARKVEEPLTAEAKAIVEAYADKAASIRGAPLGPSPSIEARSTPQLIFYDYDSNRITIPNWEDQPDVVKAVFQKFSGGTDAQAEKFFKTFFNRFLVAHEVSHWFQFKTWKSDPPDFFLMEQDANALAVAFWRTQPNGEIYLSELEKLATSAANAFPDPTPAGLDASEYFGKNYVQLGSDPTKYGHYQFRFIAEAIRARSKLDFSQMISRQSSGNDTIRMSEQ